MILNALDVCIIITYLAGITAFGAHFRHRQYSLRDYFLGGRQLPWWAIALSVVSAETSVLTIISTPGIAYRSNLSFLQLVLGYLVGRVIVSFVLIPRYFAGDLFTAYQLIERRFGNELRTFTAGMFLISRALAEGVRVFAISIVVEAVFKTGVLVSVVMITVLTIFYTFQGGFTAVIWTDVIQLLIYVTGTTLALIFALHTTPGGWSEVVRIAHTAGDRFRIFDFHFNWHEPYVFWSGVVGGTFLTSASHGTDQLIVQRLLAARSKRQSQAALLSSGLVILAQFALFLLVGVVLYAFYAHHSQPESFARADKVYPTFVATALPHGFSGLLIAAILSAGMANLSAALNALASSSVVDFYRPYVRPIAGEKHYLRLSRVLTVFWGIALLVIAISAQLLHQSVLELALTIASVPYGSMLGIFLLAVLTKRVTARAALVGAVLGLLVLTGIMLGNWMHVFAIAWTWYVVIGTSITFAAGWLASIVS